MTHLASVVRSDTLIEMSVFRKEKRWAVAKASSSLLAVAFCDISDYSPVAPRSPPTRKLRWRVLFACNFGPLHANAQAVRNIIVPPELI